MRSRALAALAVVMLIAGCDAARSAPSDAAPSTVSTSASVSQSPFFSTLMDPESSVRDDRAACFYIGSATTWPVHTLEWFDDMDQAKFDAVDRDLKAVLKEASAFPTPPVSERARLMNQAINGCHALGLPIFGPRRHVEATEGDIDACAIVSKVPPDASYAESDAPLVRAWREAEDFWLWVRLYHLNWGAGDPKFARLRDSTLGRCRIIHANEATPSSGD